MANKIILGTAQLGMPYGIANTQGQPDQDVATEIVATALNTGITYFDTAQIYGVSEQILGKALQTLKAQSKAKIITKVASNNLQDEQLLLRAFNTSLQNMGVSSLYCFMLHHEDYLPLLNAWQGDFLKKLQEQGKINHLGISIYSPDLALQALEHPLIQVVQVPSSLLDRRFIKAGVFKLAKKLNKEIHIRSVFLQGVLCMPPKNLPTHLTALNEPISIFQTLCTKYACTPSQAAIAWMQYCEPESFLIFGAETSTQVQENTNISWQNNCNVQEFLNQIDEIYAPQEAKLLNPALWNK